MQEIISSNMSKSFACELRINENKYTVLMIIRILSISKNYLEINSQKALKHESISIFLGQK